MKILTSLFLAACAATAPVLTQAQQKPDVVNISYVLAPFNLPSIVMRDKGYLDQAFAAKGIKVKNMEITSGAKQTQAMAAGGIDIASVLGSASVILARANGIDLQIIAAYARSPKAYLLMTRADGPAHLADLKGKKIAGPKGTVLNQLLAAVLTSQHLSLADVQYFNMDIPTARAALLAGQVDVATLAGNNALIVEKAGGKVLTSGEGFIKPTAVIAARTDFIKQHPDLVATYLQAHRRALEFIAQHPEQALELGAKDQKISIDEARTQLALYDFNPTLSADDIANLNADQVFMIGAKMLPASNAIDIGKDLIAASAKPVH